MPHDNGLISALGINIREMMVPAYPALLRATFVAVVDLDGAGLEALEDRHWSAWVRGGDEVMARIDGSSHPSDTPSAAGLPPYVTLVFELVFEVQRSALLEVGLDMDQSTLTTLPLNVRTAS